MSDSGNIQEVTDGGESITEKAWRLRMDAGRYRLTAREEPEHEAELMTLAEWSAGKSDMLVKLARYGRDQVLGSTGPDTVFAGEMV